MKNNKFIGFLGENIAQSFLLKNQYRILARNYKSGFDEIDIIARSIEGILVFIEVKTLYKYHDFSNEFMPEDNLTPFKLKCIMRASQKFLGKNPLLLNDEWGWRIDLIAITIKRSSRYNLRHYINI